MLRIVQHGFSEQEPMHTLLRMQGVEPIHAPFLEHEALEVERPSVIPEVILVSSARTVSYWGAWGSWIRNHRIPVVSISQKTQQRLMKEGISSLCAQGTGDRLIEMLDTLPYSSFFHIGAWALSSKLEAAFQNQERPYHTIPVYRSKKHRDFFVHEDVVLGCLNSERCANIWKEHSPNTPVVCLGTTTAKRALTLGLDVRGIAEHPSREKMVDAVVVALGDVS